MLRGKFEGKAGMGVYLTPQQVRDAMVQMAATSREAPELSASRSARLTSQCLGFATLRRFGRFHCDSHEGGAETSVQAPWAFGETAWQATGENFRRLLCWLRQLAQHGPSGTDQHGVARRLQDLRFFRANNSLTTRSPRCEGIRSDRNQSSFQEGRRRRPGGRCYSPMHS